MKNQASKQEVWIGVEHLENDPAFLKSIERELSDSPAIAQEEAMSLNTNRRDFLKFLGFGVGAATVAAGCDIPVKRAIPYVTKPDDIVPGVANYYASSFVQGGDYCAVLVKTREGRPIKIEGNNLSSVTKGRTNARAQASVLSLYDTNRFQKPMKKAGDPSGVTKWAASSWAEVDKDLSGVLTPTSQIRIVTGTILSPTAKKVLLDFIAKYPNTKVVAYDAISSSAILEANEQCFAQKVIPNYRFDRADVVVTFGADFLGTWISPVEFASQWVENRRVKDVKNPKMSRLIAVESAMTLTGSNADNRILVKPSETGAAIATLHNELAERTGKPGISAPKVEDSAAAALKALAAELLAARGKALVVSGSNNVGEQVLVNSINAMLDAYDGAGPISFANASLQRQGFDRDIQGLTSEMNGGRVDAVLVWGANPAYNLPNSDEFAAAFSKVKTKVSLAYSPDETSDLCDYVAPTSHYLESWGDAEPKRGHYSLMQPTIAPLFDTRQAEETLLRWSGNAQAYYDYLRASWQSEVFPKQNKFATFQSFWDTSLHDGVVEFPQADDAGLAFGCDMDRAAGMITKPAEGDGLEISFYETVSAGAGQYADNPWLQELPDPVNRCVWGNNMAIPIEFDGNRRFHTVGEQLKNLNENEYHKEADIVEVDVEGKKQRVTCVRQFGQKRGTLAIALGYGRTVAGACGKGVGTNAFPWLTRDANGNTQYFNAVASVSEKVGTDEYASVQYHHTMGVTGKVKGSDETLNVDEVALMTLGKGYQGSLVDRSIIRRANVKDVAKFVEELHHEREHHQHLNDQTLYPYEEYVKDKYSQGHHWGLHVDLNACIGCGTCAVACTAENNVPVVGRHEVYRHHEMTWMRIDRYFYGDYENPNVVYQPLMCQHCDQAPCENVCPVSATNHSSEGLNQMAYNRCIGTRYCANNCPYKVRRFNWLDYTTADLFPANEVMKGDRDLPFYADNLTRMVLNPDVTVRSRGVMEKCSFCVQRIQEGKLTAKKEGRALRDGEVKSACQTACPTGAITFGDQNLKDSEVNKRFADPLNYIVLEEVDTRPNVMYTAKVGNREEAMG